eukprot:1296833-Rhodomonas_salina.1
MFVSTSFQNPTAVSDNLTFHSASVNDEFLDLPRCLSRELSGLFEDEDPDGMVDSWFASGSTSPKPASSAALAAVS